jgi:hypothetical protein
MKNQFPTTLKERLGRTAHPTLTRGAEQAAVEIQQDNRLEQSKPAETNHQPAGRGNDGPDLRRERCCSQNLSSRVRAGIGVRDDSRPAAGVIEILRSWMFVQTGLKP